VKRPTREELEAAVERRIKDVIAPGLDVLFCGINPGLYSGATGHHFARPGNRFWPALHRSGFTPKQLHPSEQRVLLELGLGVTNVVARTTRAASELTPEELRNGARRLRSKVRRYAPRYLAVLGLGAYRIGFGETEATLGPQGDLGRTRVWVLPNPSGLNAHYQLDALAAEFARLREAAETARRRVGSSSAATGRRRRMGDT
jgi:double-stranded uracil-DNA glycosylase